MELGHDEVHASLRDGIAHHVGEGGDARKLDVCALAGDEDDLLLLAVANESEERIDGVNIADQIVHDL